MDRAVKIMPCLDMQNGRVVKGVHFIDIKDAGDPVECARAYCESGADELALLDITATVEGRATMLDVVKRVAEVTTVPFTVGGGISDVKTAVSVIDAGAATISTSSAAFRNPELVRELVTELGPEKVTVAVDVDRNEALPSGYEVYIDGGRTATGAGKLEHFYEAAEAGAAILLAASVFHFGIIEIGELKDYLRGRGISVLPTP